MTSLNIGLVARSDFGTENDLPSDFSGMTSLTFLAIYGSSFTGSLPTVYPQTLKSLTLSSMLFITGTIPQVIVDLPALTDFGLSSLPSITGPLPRPSNASASKLTQYQVVDMAVTGTIPSSILGLKANINLQSLPHLTGPFPTLAATSDSGCRLSTIYLNDVSLTGTPFPTGLAENCATLQQLTFLKCGLTGQIDDFTAAPSFGGIRLENNPLRGTIPIITFAQKASLTMSACNLTDVVPTAYLNSTAFSSIAFNGNKLDLCSNGAAVRATGFVNSTDESCNLFGQTPSECGCPNVWPARCFSTPMPGECPPAPVPITAPVPSSIPVAPTHSVPGSVPSTPTNGSVSLFASFGLISALAVVMSLL